MPLAPQILPLNFDPQSSAYGWDTVQDQWTVLLLIQHKHKVNLLLPQLPLLYLTCVINSYPFCTIIYRWHDHEINLRNMGQVTAIFKVSGNL